MGSGWCPECGRPLYAFRVNLQGTCTVHGYVNAEFAAPPIVVNAEADDLDVLGRYIGSDESVVRYRTDTGEPAFAPAECVQVMTAHDIEGGDWD